MYRFEPATHSRLALRDTTLKGAGALVQAGRWFSSRAGILLGAFAHSSVISLEKASPSRVSSHPRSSTFLEDHVYHNAILMELRVLLDTKAGHLGIGRIASTLNDPTTRAEFCQFLDKSKAPGRMIDANKRDKYLDYLLKYARILSETVETISPASHPLVEKAHLVRRIANKAIVHSTLDEAILSGRDLFHVVTAVTVLACVIDSVMGDEASAQLEDLETAGYSGAARTFSRKIDTSPNIVASIRALLPFWIESGQEFPDCPA